MAFPAPVVELPDCQMNWESLQSIVDTFNSRLSIGLYMAGDIKVTFAIVAPTGWILLTGQTINPIQTLFPDLAAAMGVTGSITFPDCRGRAIIGAGTGAGLTARTIRSVAGTEASNMPSHSHGGATTTVNGGNPNLDHLHPVHNAITVATINGGVTANVANDGGGNTSGADRSLNHTHNITAEGGGADNMMPWTAANIMLRTANN